MPPKRTARLHLGGVARVWLLVSALAAAAAGLYGGSIRGLHPVPGHALVPWWALALGFYLAEAYVVHLHFRREAHTLSLNELPLVLGLFFASPTGLLAAQLAGAAPALLLHRRQKPLKAAFNVVQFALCTSLALTVFHTVADAAGDPIGPRGWTATFLALSAASVCSVLLVGLAIWLAEGATTLRELPKVLAIALVGTTAVASLALVAVELIDAGSGAVLLLLIPAAACALSLRIYSDQRSRHQHLEFLYESMRSVQGAPDFEAAVARLLRAAGRLLRADFAELVLMPPSLDEQAFRSVSSGEGLMLMKPIDLGPLERLVHETASATGGAVLLPAGREPHALDGYLAARGLEDAILTTLHGELRALGFLVVGNRSGDVSTFTDDDRKLFETFAGHAGILLENDRLEQALAGLTELQEQLRHQAFHDALTGLPNRALFADQVAEDLLAARPDRDRPIVLFVDLDDFKTINDSLGHAAGDELLVAVAQRIAGCVRPGDVPARLGGDEFAILVRGADVAQAELVADRVMATLRDPFTLHGRQVAVHASIGIAAAETGGSTSDELLRNADVAMYSAKGNGKHGYAVYEPEMHVLVQRRQELAAALQRAIEREEIRAHFQPIVSLADGSIVGFEALARWHTPGRTIIHPDEFITLAEETGLMIPIGRAILRDACERSVDWADRYVGGETLDIAVNLSLTELRNPRLPEEIAAVLGETGLDPRRLVVEVTESTAMRHPAAAIATLHEVRKLGVRVALDDFGTGYSSLSHLCDLPVDRLKVAKTFVEGLLDDDFQPVLAETILSLAGALGLECVAEGIEHPRQAAKLRRLGCGMGQGYMFGRPLSAEAVEEQLQLGAAVALPPVRGVVPIAALALGAAS